MLKSDPALPFLEMAWSKKEMIAFFDRDVLPVVHPGRRVVGLKRERMAYSAGRKCVALYTLHLDGPHSEVSHRAVVTFARDGWLEEAGVDLTRANGSARSALHVPAYGCLVEFFPNDWQLPGLRHGADAVEVAHCLASTAPDKRATTSARVEVDIIRYRPHETCVLRYRVDAEDGEPPRDVIGKLYRDSAKAEHVWAAMRALYSQGANARALIPRPLGLKPEWNLVLMECAPGVSMKRVLVEAGSDEARRAAKQAAAAVASYHTLELQSDDVRTVQTELAKLEKRAARLRCVAPAFSVVVDDFLKQVESRAATLGDAPPSFIHGDCKPNQLLLDGDHVAIVDFDRSCVGDPAIDVGNFMSQFPKFALSTGHDHLRELAPYFLAEYQARARRPGLEERARLFQALSLARMAVRKLENSPQTYARGGVSSPQVALLEEAKACLAEL